jgi:single-strand DNA-binding protein
MSHATIMTITGNAVTTPERRKTKTGVSVTSFRIASTERKYDSERGDWADGRSVFLTIKCWRQLADNVHRSVVKGDPLVLTGRFYTREYEHEGQRRTAYEVEADAVGFNLAKGSSTFTRTRAMPAPFEINDGVIPEDDMLDDELDVSAAPLGEAFSAEEYQPAAAQVPNDLVSV